jgi:hypothetical protein
VEDLRGGLGVPELGLPRGRHLGFLVKMQMDAVWPSRKCDDFLLESSSSRSCECGVNLSIL